jgi:hypothetical protein
VKRTAIALAALAAIVALPSLANGFVYDDIPIIVENPLVHQLGALDAWRSSYWPAGGLYRPLTLQLFSLEWALGGGRPWLFHAVSLLLAALTTILVYRLAARLLPEAGAIAAGALFAVHPVHVEAVASAVGQSELLSAVFALIAVERYLAWRGSVELTAGRRAALAGCTLLAIAAKETGYVVPLLLVAAELCRPRSDRRGVTALFALQAAAVVSGLLVRLIALGSLAGESPSASFYGLSASQRAIGMLLVVPEWARLLLWPARLQAEYGPPGLALDAPFGAMHGLGVALLAAAVALLVGSWRQNRLVAFGVLWVGIALLPVSNVLTAAGLVLGERTLYLPSAGIVLLLGAAVAAGADRLGIASRGVRVTIAVATVCLVMAAGLRNVMRQRVWRSEEVFFGQIAQDAPRSYRAHLMVSRYYYAERRYSEAEAAAWAALRLYRNDPRVHEQLGQLLRVQGRCAEALPVLSDGVARFPDGTIVRSRLIECAIAVGDTGRAWAVAEDAVALGYPEFESTLKRLSRPAPEPPRTR